MVSLTIHHNIHLTKEQRYALHEGKDIEVVGVSVPIWFMNKLTTEPGREIFCKYVLKNPKTETPIQILTDGYEISLPNRTGTKLEISDEEWREINRIQPAKLDALYRQLVNEVSSKNLLDIEDGGHGHMYYREHNKVKRGDKLWTIMHFVCIGSQESLLQNLSYVALGRGVDQR